MVIDLAAGYHTNLLSGSYRFQSSRSLPIMNKLGAVLPYDPDIEIEYTTPATIFDINFVWSSN